MNSENIQEPNGNVLVYGNKQFRFKITDLGGRTLEGEQLRDFIEPLNDIQLLVVTNQRWLSFIKRDGRYYIMNCHATRVDGTADYNDVAPAVIMRADSSQEAAEIIKLFACASDSPRGIFYTYIVKLTPID